MEIIMADCCFGGSSRSPRPEKVAWLNEEEIWCKPPDSLRRSPPFLISAEIHSNLLLHKRALPPAILHSACHVNLQSSTICGIDAPAFSSCFDESSARLEVDSSLISEMGEDWLAEGWPLLCISRIERGMMARRDLSSPSVSNQIALPARMVLLIRKDLLEITVQRFELLLCLLFSI